MKKSNFYQKYLDKWQEVVDLPTQKVGVFTPYYKQAVPFLKTAPWKMLIPISFFLAVIIALILEVSILQIASILQKGI